MFGIALGVAALIIVLSVMNGFQKEVTDRMLGVISHIEIFSRDGQALGDIDAINVGREREAGQLGIAVTVDGDVMAEYAAPLDILVDGRDAARPRVDRPDKEYSHCASQPGPALAEQSVSSSLPAQRIVANRPSSKEVLGSQPRTSRA